MKWKLYLCVCILLCCACTDNKNQTTVVTAFEKTGTLIAQVKKMPEPILLPRFMGIANNQLFVYKEREKVLFDFFTLPDCSYLGSAGTRGQGPDEFGLLDTRSFSTSENNFSVVEAGTNVLKTVVYKDGRLTVTHSESIFEQGISNIGFYELKDSIYLTLGNIVDANEYCLFNRKTKEIIKTSKYPQWTNVTETKDASPLAFTYIKSCVVHPDGDKFAGFYGYFKRFRIYDYSINLLHDVDVRIEPCSTHFATGPAEVKHQPVYYIGQPQAVGNYIYALCANAPGSGVDVVGDSELHVFDWEGQPIARYKLDKQVSLFAVSEKYRKIIALDNRVDDELYLYDLPEHIN